MSPATDSADSDRVKRFILPALFGYSVQVKILEILLRNAVEEAKVEHPVWLNFSDIAKQARVAKSSGKRILDSLKKNGWIEEKKIETHAQSPPRSGAVSKRPSCDCRIIIFL